MKIRVMFIKSSKAGTRLGTINKQGPGDRKLIRGTHSLRTAAVVTVSTTEEMEERAGPMAEWALPPPPARAQPPRPPLPPPQHQPPPHHPPARRRMQVSTPPPPVALELEVAATDVWCHTYTHNARGE